MNCKLVKVVRKVEDKKGEKEYTFEDFYLVFENGAKEKIKENTFERDGKTYSNRKVLSVLADIDMPF